MMRLRLLRKEKKLTLEELSEKVNISYSQIAKFERGDSLMNSDQSKMFADFFGVSVDYLLGIDSLPKGSIPYQNELFKPVKLLGSIPAGLPIDITNYGDIVGYLMASVDDPDNHFYLEVVGDSMAPTLLDGDFVLVKFNNTANHNQIVVAGLNGYEATVKRFKKIGDDMFLFPDNEKYQPIKLSEELHPYIVGVVVGLFRPKI